MRFEPYQQPAPPQRGESISSAGWRRTIVIGLVNMMPRETTQAITRRFVTLIEGFSDLNVVLKIYHTHEEEAVDQINGYLPIRRLWNEPVDGLIVTGAMPQAKDIQKEPSWPLLTELTDWAAENTSSAIWSCFSAHAVVQHLESIPRQRMALKLSGVYECMRQTDHNLVRTLPQSWKVPHSRYNTLCTNTLISHGFTILSCMSDGSADMFTRRQKQSQFVFMQGHLEYSRNTLLAEYRRDLQNYLNNHQLRPTLPAQYFDTNTVETLQRWESTIDQMTNSDAIASFDDIPKTLLPDLWSACARRFYQSWLFQLAHKKANHSEHDA